MVIQISRRRNIRGEKDAKKMTLGTREPSASLVFSLLPEFDSLVNLNLHSNGIGTGGAESLAGVLAQCTVLVHLNLWNNHIGTVGQGRFEIRGGVKPLPFVCRHLGQLALCHLFNRRGTRKSDMLYTYHFVVFWLPLSLWAKPV